jgi:ubiquinone/menaquinone biosynthesis C-methylase UbiE
MTSRNKKYKNKDNTLNSNQKSMPWIAFKIMTLIMNIRKKFRNIEEEVSLAGINQGDFILDFGCGPGFNTISAAKKVGGEGKVFALDISAQAIKIVNNKIRKNNLINVETILSDCETGIGDKNIDIVYLHNTLPLIRNKEQVIKEIYRVLKIGGRFSYMSRAISLLAGKNSLNNYKLIRFIEAWEKFKLVKKKNGHLIFEKIM